VKALSFRERVAVNNYRVWVIVLQARGFGYHSKDCPARGDKPQKVHKKTREISKDCPECGPGTEARLLGARGSGVFNWELGKFTRRGGVKTTMMLEEDSELWEPCDVGNNRTAPKSFE